MFFPCDSEQLIFAVIVLVALYVFILNLIKLKYLFKAEFSHNECEKHYYKGLYRETSWFRLEWNLPASNRIREIACHRWGWAIPTASAISTIIQAAKDDNCSCIIDYGAGRGYWSHLLARQAPASFSIIAMDANPAWYIGESHYPLKAGGIGAYGARRDGPERVDPADERAARQCLGRPMALLLMVWPPCWSPMAADALDAFAGPTLVYVGEPAGGRTASAAFFQRLDSGWRLQRRVALPNWSGCADALYLFSRRGQPDS